MTYQILGDLVAGLHAAWVLAVVLGLLLVLAGGALGWQWTSNRWVRGVHLAMIVLVILRSAIWEECPLTTWERDLRAIGAQQAGGASAVGQFFHDIIHPPLPLWVFPLVYCLFGLLVAGTLWLVPVRWRARRDADDAIADADPAAGRAPV